MKKPDLLNELDRAVKNGDTDIDLVSDLAARALQWMPFEFITMGDDKEKEVGSAEKYNARQLRNLKKSPAELNRAATLKAKMADQVETLFTKAYEKYGSGSLPKHSDRMLDGTTTYWDEVAPEMRRQFTELNDSYFLEGLAIQLAYGLHLNLDRSRG